jgi:hypothetical protein
MLHLSKLTFSTHIGMHLILLVQLLLVLGGINLLLASYQQQAMLEEPFEEILQKDGYYLSLTGGIMLDADGSITDALEGEKEIISFSNYVCDAEIGGQTLPIKLFVYEDDFWCDYSPVMQQGTWIQPDTKSEYALCVATANCPDGVISLPGVSVTLKASGILSSLTYIPSMNAWSRNGGIDENLYNSYNAATEETVCLLMPRTQWEKLGIPEENLVSSSNVIVYFTSLTEEQAAYNEKLLEQAASPGIPLSTLYERAENARLDTVRRYLPLLIALLLVTIFGILCAISIHLLQDLHSYAVYYLCGMQWRSCILLSTMQLGMLLVLALAICFSGYCMLRITGRAAVLGLRFSLLNPAVSLGFCIILLILGSLFPYLMLKSHAPMTLLRRTDA